MALDTADAALGALYATDTFAGAAHVGGIAAGLSHVALTVGYYSGALAGDKHSRHCKGFGHAVLAAGHFAGAAGAGVWCLAPLVSGIIITTMQDHRDRN